MIYSFHDGKRGKSLHRCTFYHHAQKANPYSLLNRLDEIEVFEALVNDMCLDKDDILIHQDTWKICRVDFSEAFAPRSDLPEGCPINRCSTDLYYHLEKTVRQVVEDKLRAYLNKDEIAALCNRKTRIVIRLKQLIKEKGEKAVLF